MKDFKYKLMVALYKGNRLTKRVFYKYINKKEGGEFRSETLRRIFREKHKISIGYASYGCFDPWINFGSPMEIGNYCSFAANIHFIPGNHPPTDVSTHPYFHRPEFGFVNNSGGEEIKAKNESKRTTVGHDVWIGRDVDILPKCKTIGNGAIIGAGSVVTHDVKPYSIVAGNPAREICKRFNEETINRLESSKWYLYPPEKLANAFQYAKDIDKFLEEIKRIKDK